MTKQFVVFSDLDATLLDHHDYSFDAATTALAKLKSLNIPVVLNSSKTMAEMNLIRIKLDNHAPFIIENGGALIIPPHYFDNVAGEMMNFSTEYKTILQTLSALKDKGFKFRNFDSLSAQAISGLTNLSEADAKLAKQRFASEPLLWDDTEQQFKLFSQEIDQRQLKLIKGGRFYHVTGLFSKGDAIIKARTLFEKKYPDKKIVTIGLGDSPNDLPMLATVDIAIVIRSGRLAEMQLNRSDAIISKLEGPAGWNEEILTLLEQQGI
jgi:mannosyl-3-phosphoglycerate phosphatase